MGSDTNSICDLLSSSASFYRLLVRRLRFNKFHAIKTKVDGIEFHSRSEAQRYAELKLLEIAGEIRDLELQPRFDLIVNGIKICKYYADFRYWDIKKRELIIEDRKGVRTVVFNLKKKLMKACLGLDIFIT